jgi:hypothetical protein
VSGQLHALTDLSREQRQTGGRASRGIGLDLLAKRKILPLAGFELWSFTP